MLGHPQDAGNTTTLAHYLELLAGAGMLVGLQKYAAGASRQRGSSPKLQVLNTALMTAQSGVSLVDATVDAYGDSEQATAFLTVLEECLALPFGATVLGEAVVVEEIDLSDADELIAMCRRRGKRQKVRLLDLELHVPRPKGAEWVAAYNRWSRRR